MAGNVGKTDVDVRKDLVELDARKGSNCLLVPITCYIQYINCYMPIVPCSLWNLVLTAILVNSYPSYFIL